MSLISLREIRLICFGLGRSPTSRCRRALVGHDALLSTYPSGPGKLTGRVGLRCRRRRIGAYRQHQRLSRGKRRLIAAGLRGYGDLRLIRARVARYLPQGWLAAGARAFTLLAPQRLNVAFLQTAAVGATQQILPAVAA